MDFGIYALAVWRVSYALVNEAGPWQVFVKLREHYGIEHDPGGLPVSWPEGTVLGCVGCASVWIALGLLPLMGSWLLLPFAASAVAKVVTDRLYE